MVRLAPHLRALAIEGALPPEKQLSLFPALAVNR